jgi:hypothetical protein
MYRKRILIPILLLPSIVVGQCCITGVPFLEIIPGPGLYMNSGAFTALPSNDIYAAWANPAQISNFGQRVGVGFYTQKSDWFISDISFHSSALAAGAERGRYRYGAGLMRTDFDYGRQDYTDEHGNSLGSYSSREFVNALSVGAGVDLGINLNVGITYKHGESRLFPSGILMDNHFVNDAPIRVADIGIQMMVPIPKYMGVSAEFGVGYAIRNIGGTLSYKPKDSDSYQQDPYPRVQSIGYSGSVTHRIPTSRGEVKTITFDVSVNVEDLLVNPNLRNPSEGRRWSYSGPIGDIRVLDHFIRRKSDDRITIRQGWRVELFETIRIGKGWMNGPAQVRSNRYNGFEIDVTRLAEFAIEFRSPLTILYSQSDYELGNFQDSRPFRGLTISWDLN